MGIETQQKLNQLQRDLPEGMLATARWLGNKGYSHQLLKKYKQGGWLVSPVRGVYRRPGPSLKWQQVVASLQLFAQLPLHLGGKTALIHRGLAHYLQFGRPETIHLYGTASLPVWVSELSVEERFQRHSDAAFDLPRVFRDSDRRILNQQGRVMQPGDLEASGLTLFSWDTWDWDLVYSSEERAVLELLEDVPDQETVASADTLIQGLTNLRPQRLTRMLKACRSIKVKRLFLALAERHQHAWFGQLDLSKVDLGRGKRVLVRGGVLHPRYQITLPADLGAQAR